MKRILNLLGVLLLLLTACSKTETQNTTGGGGVSPVPPLVPTLSLKADTALCNGSAIITVTSNAQSVININNNQVVNGSVVITGLTKDSVVSFIAKNTNGTLIASATASIIVKCWSAKTTQLQSYTPLGMISSKSCIAGTENDPNTTWYDGPIDPNFWIKFFANGGGQTNLWTYSAGKGWAWADPDEKSIAFGIDANGNLTEIWNVTLLPNGFDRTQVKNGYYTIQKFRE